MKNPLFQLIASGVVLGMMGGGVVIHSLHISGAKELSEGTEWESDGTQSSLEVRSFIAPTALVAHESRSGTRSGGDSSEPEMAATVVALEEIVSRLRELKAENSNLIGQLQETNRDLMELQFRVDSHSESFRPMRVSPAPAPVKGHLLLPPKR